MRCHRKHAVSWLSFTTDENADISQPTYEDSHKAPRAYEEYSRNAEERYEDNPRQHPGNYEDYSGEAEDRYDVNPRQHPGNYEDYSGEAEDPYHVSSNGAPGDQENSPREETGGYEDTRIAVRDMLKEMAQKKRNGICKEVKRDGMSCLQCSDAKGVQVTRWAGGRGGG